jgi:hypothetical protein
MQDDLLPQLKQPALSFGEFLSALIGTLQERGVRYCVLRNYEEFPDRNTGRDIDFLIDPHDLEHALSALGSVEHVRIVGYLKRAAVAIVYLDGVFGSPDIRGLEVDFDLSLDWKGLPYLSVAAVLDDAVPRRVGGLEFYVPCPVHEATISLFGSLLIGGFIKERYFAKVQKTFASKRSESIAVLQSAFSSNLAVELVNAVITGSKQKALEMVSPLRRSLALRSIISTPVRSIYAVLRHYLSEVLIRLSPRTLTTVCILSPDSTLRKAVVDAILPRLAFYSGEVRRLDLEIDGGGVNEGECTEGVGRSPGMSLSVAPMAKFLWRVWLARIKPRKNLTLYIIDSAFVDLLAFSNVNRMNGLAALKRMAARLFLRGDFWILVDSTLGMSLSSSNDSMPVEQRAATGTRIAFTRLDKNKTIVITSEDREQLTEATLTAMTNALAERTLKGLPVRA